MLTTEQNILRTLQVKYVRSALRLTNVLKRDEDIRHRTMARDHRLDFSNDKPSPNPTFRLDPERSRSPKRHRGESWTPSNSAEGEPVKHDGRRWRGKVKARTETEYRERSPDHPGNATQRTQAKHQKRNKDRGDDTETKGLSDKIHSLRRLLEKAIDMPADIRQEKERELQGYMADQQRRQARREKNAVTSRYHFVRFMERKKAERKLKQMEKNFDSVMMESDSATSPENTTGARTDMGEGDAETIVYGADGPRILSSAERLALQQADYERRLHVAKVDLNYTLYAPLDQKYISLYPATQKEGESHANKGRRKRGGGKAHPVIDDEDAGLLRNNSGVRPPLWYEVEKAMKNDALEALRDGKVFRAEDEGGALPFRSEAEPANGKRVRGIESGSGDENEDEESDGDFFER